MKHSNIIISKFKLSSADIHLTGYKHAMVQIIAASIATNIPIIIKNAPLVDDTFVLAEIINSCGGMCTLDGHTLNCDPRNMHLTSIPEHLSEKIHGSLYLMPAYASRFGEFKLGKTGGCQIGSTSAAKERPFEHMLRVMEKFMISSSIENGQIRGKRISDNIDMVNIDIKDFSDSPFSLTGSCISGATKTALLMSSLAKSLAIKNPYLKTDVRDLLRFLQMIGANVIKEEKEIRISFEQEFISDSNITFSLTECVSQIITYIAIAICCDIELRLYVTNLSSIKIGLQEEFNILDKMGINYKFEENCINVLRTDKINSVDIDVTNDSIQSDHLPFFALMLLKADKPSTLREFVWPERFAYVSELKKLGANIVLDGNKLVVKPSTLEPKETEIFGHDTRASAVSIIAALMTNSSIIIKNIHHLYRGYEGFLENLTKIGAKIIPYHDHIN